LNGPGDRYEQFLIDESAAEVSAFKGLAASGWHTAAVAMRLFVACGLPFANGIVGLGGEIAWPRPTRPGDILHVEAASKRGSGLPADGQAFGAETPEALKPPHSSESLRAA
jgi:acyl dehydratase